MGSVPPHARLINRVYLLRHCGVAWHNYPNKQTHKPQRTSSGGFMFACIRNVNVTNRERTSAYTDSPVNCSIPQQGKSQPQTPQPQTQPDLRQARVRRCGDGCFNAENPIAVPTGPTKARIALLDCLKVALPDPVRHDRGEYTAGRLGVAGYR